MSLISRVKSKISRIKMSINEKFMPTPSAIEAQRIEKLRDDIRELINFKVLSTDFWSKNAWNYIVL